ARTFTGKIAVVDAAGQSGKDWRAVVQLAAREAHHELPFTGPLQVTLRFSMPRPKAHFGKRGLRPMAPRYPAVAPDVDKLSRNCLDAMTAVIYRDDSQIVQKTVTKLYASVE